MYQTGGSTGVQCTYTVYLLLMLGQGAGEGGQRGRGAGGQGGGGAGGLIGNKFFGKIEEQNSCITDCWQTFMFLMHARGAEDNRVGRFSVLKFTMLPIIN